MRCESCSVGVNPEFIHAINNNQCPACGKNIMQQAKLASFLSLKTLLENNILEKGADIDKIASLIVANFEIKQLFKEELKKSGEEGIIEVDEEESTKAKVQQDEQQSQLQKMRDEAFNEALKDQYGGFSEKDNMPVDIDSEPDINPDIDVDSVYSMINKDQNKQAKAMKAVNSGTANVRRHG